MIHVLLKSISFFFLPFYRLTHENVIGNLTYAAGSGDQVQSSRRDLQSYVFVSKEKNDRSWILKRSVRSIRELFFFIDKQDALLRRGDTTDLVKRTMHMFDVSEVLSEVIRLCIAGAKVVDICEQGDQRITT